MAILVSCDKEIKLWIQEQTNKNTKQKTVDELIEKGEAFKQAHKGVQVNYRASHLQNQ